MTYNINPAIFGNTYAVPSVVADKYLKIATHTQLKVLLYFMRNISEGIAPQKIADALSLPLSEVDDALLSGNSAIYLLVSPQKKKRQKRLS